MKKIEFALLFGLILSILLTSFTSFSLGCDEVREDTLRLHILANSDTKKDQEAKLYVRDKLLESNAKLFSRQNDKSEAKISADENIALIEKTARDALAEKGLYYDVKAYITNMYFATTQYDGFTLPAGRYDALRIELGKAKGKNWFCVLFPPMCVPAAMDDAAAYSRRENTVIHEKHKIKFAIVELFANLH
ncbi:MAG: stage II sporulation protein R [Oscillospiraceae bacterium]